MRSEATKKTTGYFYRQRVRFSEAQPEQTNRPAWIATIAADGNPDTWQEGQPMTNKPDIDSEWIALARAVIIQAAREAVEGNADAVAWLAADETADTWYLVAGVRRSAVLAWLNKPRIQAGAKRGNRSRSTTTGAKITSANKQAVI